MIGLLATTWLFLPPAAAAQVKAQARTGATPAWDKGILPISAESYWHAVECGKQGGENPAPTPSFQEAQRTRVTVGVAPERGSKNPIATVVVRRGGKVVPPATTTMEPNGGRFTFDYSAFAATGSLTLDLVGKTKTISCAIDQPTLSQFR